MSNQYTKAQADWLEAQPDYQTILKAKQKHYGRTEMSYESAADEYANKFHEWKLANPNKAKTAFEKAAALTQKYIDLIQEIQAEKTKEHDYAEKRLNRAVAVLKSATAITENFNSNTEDQCQELTAEN